MLKNAIKKIIFIIQKNKKIKVIKRMMIKIEI